MFILGFSLFFSLVLPKWMEIEENKASINTGNATIDNIILVILSSSMFLAMVLGFILDNTIPGTPEERGQSNMYFYTHSYFDFGFFAGIIKWQNQHKLNRTGYNERLKVYDLPFITPWIKRQKFSKYFPCLPREQK